MARRIGFDSLNLASQRTGEQVNLNLRDALRCQGIVALFAQAFDLLLG
jgi:hypothetical protein